MESQNKDYKPDGFEVQIEVGAPQQKSELGVKKYWVYPVKGEDKHGAIEISRRYSDFDHLRNALVARWPGCFITSLPQKKYLGNNQQQFIEVRRKGLEQFLRIISKIGHLWYSQQMQIFLKQKNGDVEKQISALVTRTSPIELTQRYEMNFKEFENVELTHQMNNKILQFSLYLKQVTPMLDNLIVVSQAMVATRKQQNQRYASIMDFMLPQYQKNCMKQYLPEVNNSQDCLIFSSSNEDNGIKQAQRRLKESFGSLQSGLIMEGMKKEKRQILSFLDTIRVRDQFEAAKQRSIGKVKDIQIERQKISAGKTSVLAKIRSLTKQQQLQVSQKQLDEAALEEKQYTYIINMINILLTHIEIQKFKRLREKTYYNLLKNSIRVEKENQERLSAYWRAIGAHDLVGANVLIDKYKKKDESKSQKSQKMQQPTQQIQRVQVYEKQQEQPSHQVQQVQQRYQVQQKYQVQQTHQVEQVHQSERVYQEKENEQEKPQEYQVSQQEQKMKNDSNQQEKQEVNNSQTNLHQQTAEVQKSGQHQLEVKHQHQQQENQPQNVGQAQQANIQPLNNENL